MVPRLYPRRAVLSLTTRFCLPHKGMTTLDYLSSGSAVILHDSLSSSLSVVTCQHVACPWLFPRYFAATWDWLQFVNEDHVRHSLQLLAVHTENSNEANPEVLLELPLASQVYTHPSRDLALLKLADSDAIASWQAAAKEFQVQTLALDTAPCEQGDDVVFLGHRQVNKELEEGYQVPMTVTGHFVGRSSGGQAFARSQELLEEGMCGGAVIRATTHECVGIVEGIVPMSTGEEDQEPPRHDRNAHEVWQMRRALAGHVALIPSHDLEEFMNEPGNLLLTGMEVPHFM